MIWIEVLLLTQNVDNVVVPGSGKRDKIIICNKKTRTNTDVTSYVILIKAQ